MTSSAGINGVAGASSKGGSAGAGGAAPGTGTDGLVGFAAHAAEGLTTTTGGDGGEVVTVTTFEQLAAHVSSEGRQVIQVQGTISTADGKYQKLRVRSNKTIVGLGVDATVEHICFDVTGWGAEEAANIAEFCEPAHKQQFTPVSNVIIRNLHFKNTLGNSSDADGIVVQCYSHHVWIDHNTFHGVPSGNDGAIDVKRGADWITVSWNHIRGWDKSMLLGHVDNNGEQDRGTLHVTYHHNYFENTRQRHPRVRFAHAHIFNNYLYNDGTVANRNASYFIVAGVESNIHAEANLVAHAKEIYLIGEESSSDAKVTYTDTNAVVPLQSGAEAIFHIPPNSAAFNPRDFYSYNAESAESLATTVPRSAGAGKI